MKYVIAILFGFLAVATSAQEDSQQPIVPPDLKPEDLAKLKDPEPSTVPPGPSANPSKSQAPGNPQPPLPSPELRRDHAQEEDAPEDRLESMIQKSADFYEKKLRAKCGGALFEAAEVLEELAQPKPKRVAAEADALRVLALDAARGQLNGHRVDLAAARAYIRLASISHERSLTTWREGKDRQAGQHWYRAAAYLDRAVAWAGYGLRSAGEETLTESLEAAASLAQGEPVEENRAKHLNHRTGQMIVEVGRSLAARADSDWEPSEEESVENSGRSGFLEGGPQEVVRRAKTGMVRLGELFKRWGTQR